MYATDLPFYDNFMTILEKLFPFVNINLLKRKETSQSH